MSRKPLALAVGIALPLLGAVALAVGAISSEALYPTVLKLGSASIRTDREGASPVVMVEIDNASQDAQGPWPWPSTRIDSLLLSVARGGARALVVDHSLYADPNHSPSASLWSELPGGLSVVVPARPSDGADPDACKIWKLPSTEVEMPFHQVDPLVLPQGVPCDDRFSAGLDTLVPSDDGLSYPLLWSDGRRLVPSLPVAALLVSAPNVSAGNWWNAGSRTLSGPHVKAELNARGEVLMRPLGAPGAGVARVNAATVLSQKGESDLFRGRVVVVGVTASGLVPTVSVPFSAALAGDRMPRAEATATVLLNLLDQSQVLQPGWAPAVPWASFAISFLLCWLGLSRVRRRWVGGALLALLAVQTVGWWILFGAGLWFTPWSFLLPAIGGALMVVLWPKPVVERPRQIPPAAVLPPRPRPGDTARLPIQPGSSTTIEVAVAAGTENPLQRGADGEIVRLGRYVDLSVIGSGGMCKVYAAHDPVMDRRVAIKILRTDKAKGQTTEQRFMREARIAGSLHHPHINTVFDFGQAEDLLYLVLEFVEGETLGQWIKGHNGVRPKALVPWLHQIADALDTAHAANVVHRDVKPSNFMIVRSTGHIKLMDFGVARTPDVTLTQAGTTVGTPNYMSPEQLQGSKVGAASDLYSFGVVVYQMLSQRLPFHGEGLTALCNAILKGQGQKLSTHRPDLAGPVESVVHKMFAVRAEDRFATGAEFAAAFEKAAEA